MGIFWGYGARLLWSGVSVAKGLRYGDSVHGSIDHVEFWPALQRQYPALRTMEYEVIPRGRVVFHKKSGRYVVYMDKKLHRTSVKRRIIRAFALPEDQTDFLTDPHYTTDEADLDRLFED